MDLVEDSVLEEEWVLAFEVALPPGPMLGWVYPFYAATPTPPGPMPFAPQMTKEQELDFLRNEAEAIKGQLEQIDARIRDLETEE